MEAVRLVEVGARDGLQNERLTLSPQIRVQLLLRLADAGLQTLEAGAFVSPRWVPQMAGSDEVFKALPVRPGVAWTALVPNLKGLEAAIAAGCREVAVFAAASEAFSQRNLNCSIDQSLRQYQQVLVRAREAGVSVRGYVSCVMGCPFSGPVKPQAVAAVSASLFGMGCYEISLGDTIGAGTPAATRALIQACRQVVPVSALAGHFHDTYGMAIANIHTALEAGVRVFDSSVGGLGGCPYSPGATGNVATEDLLYLLDGLGVRHGVDLDAVIEAGEFIGAQLGRPTASRVARALLAQRTMA
ncbi:MULTISPECIES: hydroxymethylglutaryl-CoA lyase [Pseudomonas]|jgi:hydroxymethylglutaryl-CoA lyase|uniref:hydroxymethylglutaryl-CoA lyase n=1 Tax=Pseudomonas TaxID=286 RepID=UPI0020939CAD|nr:MULTISPECIES: hydroxymethylglutaryl-CoA lyase [Pseudomonas]USS53411.1 hydroxymethylglutaryl-CoA lyase [Pseudomonas kermanshahensis]UVL69270.1 hydroxymethylglutaryl-CoA lyase [Pseudomonas sp. B21-031]